jgi:hypothetical protein
VRGGVYASLRRPLPFGERGLLPGGCKPRLCSRSGLFVPLRSPSGAARSPAERRRRCSRLARIRLPSSASPLRVREASCREAASDASTRSPLCRSCSAASERERTAVGRPPTPPVLADPCPVRATTLPAGKSSVRFRSPPRDVTTARQCSWATALQRHDVTAPPHTVAKQESERPRRGCAAKKIDGAASRGVACSLPAEGLSHRRGEADEGRRSSPPSRAARSERPRRGCAAEKIDSAASKGVACSLPAGGLSHRRGEADEGRRTTTLSSRAERAAPEGLRSGKNGKPREQSRSLQPPGRRPLSPKGRGRRREA